jgi:hypothetical protein
LTNKNYVYSIQHGFLYIYVCVYVYGINDVWVCYRSNIPITFYFIEELEAPIQALPQLSDTTPEDLPLSGFAVFSLAAKRCNASLLLAKAGSFLLEPGLLASFSRNL